MRRSELKVGDFYQVAFRAPKGASRSVSSASRGGKVLTPMTGYDVRNCQLIEFRSNAKAVVSYKKWFWACAPNADKMEAFAGRKKKWAVEKHVLAEVRQADILRCATLPEPPYGATSESVSLI